MSREEKYATIITILKKFIYRGEEQRKRMSLAEFERIISKRL